MPIMTIPGFVPRSPRASVDLPAVITPPSGRDIPARLRNLSKGGFFALCGAPLEIGSTIAVTSAELGRLTAQVRWALGYRFGAVFTDLGEEAEGRIADCLTAAATLAEPMLAAGD